MLAASASTAGGARGPRPLLLCTVLSSCWQAEPQPASARAAAGSAETPRRKGWRGRRRAGDARGQAATKAPCAGRHNESAGGNTANKMQLRATGGQARPHLRRDLARRREAGMTRERSVAATKIAWRRCPAKFRSPVSSERVLGQRYKNRLARRCPAKFHPMLMFFQTRSCIAVRHRGPSSVFAGKHHAVYREKRRDKRGLHVPWARPPPG